MTLATKTALAALLLAVAASAGCGRRGPLEQPAPLFGDRARADYEAARAADARGDAAAAADADADNDDTPEDFRRPASSSRDPAQTTAPASRVPVEGGASNNPIGAPPRVTP
jgi:predicted small lipoprotein YifL